MMVMGAMMVEVLAETGVLLAEWMRPLWLSVGILYFSASVYIAASDCDYPVWAWFSFFIIAAAILLFFNLRYWIVIPFVLLFAELLLWFAALVGGAAFFLTLYSIRGALNDDSAHLLTARELLYVAIDAIKWRLRR